MAARSAEAGIDPSAAAPTPEAPVLSLREIVVRRGGRTILDVPALDVAAGERLAIVGPNGAGKSTLLHVAGLLLDPDAGSVAISDESAERANAGRLRRETGLVLQHAALFSTGVLENAVLGLRLRGVPRREAEALARRWLDRFGVGHLAGRKARGLSGGEAQRVALARAFAVDPRLLLLDEPFAALDPPSRAALLPDLAAALAEQRAAAVLVTHDLREAAAFGHRLGVLIEGRLAQAGPVQETLARPVSLAAARVLGVENLLPGTAFRAPDGWRLRLPAGGADLAVASAAAEMADGAPARLALRAAAVRLVAESAAAPPGWNAVPLTVRNALPTPDGWAVALDGPFALAVAHPWAAGEPPRPGSVAVAAWPADAGPLVADDPG